VSTTGGIDLIVINC